jgi:hypothetical protein
MKVSDIHEEGAVVWFTYLSKKPIKGIIRGCSMVARDDIVMDLQYFIEAITTEGNPSGDTRWLSANQVQDKDGANIWQSLR